MNNKTIVTIAAILLCISSILLSMNPDQEQQYRSRCLEIDKHDKQKLYQYKNELTTQEFTYLENEKNTLKTKLSGYKTNLLKQKQTLLEAIKEKYATNPCFWQSCMNMIQNIDYYNQQHRHLPLQNASHDTNIDRNTLEFITKRLKSYHINPHRITLRTEQDSSKSSPCYSEVQIPNICESFYSLENKSPIALVFNNDLFLQLSLAHRMTLTAHLIEEIVQEASFITPNLITKFETLITTEKNSITNSDQFIALQKMCSHQLLIFLPCLDDQLIAACTLQFVSDVYNEEFTVQDYKFLSKINRHWKALEWIDQLEKIPSSVRELL